MISSVRLATQVCLVALLFIWNCFLVEAQELDLQGFEEIELPGRISDGVVYYKFNDADPRANGQDTISIVYQVPVQAWVGWAVNERSFMLGANAILGLPETGEVKKYLLGGYTVGGNQPLPDEQQTLIDASIEQTEDTTTLSFTKILEEPDEIPITRSGRNVVLSAWGSSNQLATHKATGIYPLEGDMGASNSPPSPVFKALVGTLGAAIVGALVFTLYC